MKYMSERDFEERMNGFTKPETDAELEILTVIYFGVRLHVVFDIYKSSTPDYTASGRYEVKESYNSYHGTGYEFGKGCINGYSHSGAFWKYVFGDLYCGGIAGSSYGQFEVFTHREYKRLERWQESRRRGDSRGVRPAFVRLAKQYGLGENSSTPDRSCTA